MNEAIKPCAYCQTPFRKRPNDSYQQWEARQFCSYKCRGKVVANFTKGHKINLGRKLSKEHKIKVAEAQKGSKSHFWKGGITPENLRIRSTAEYREWREAVFKKDGYRCLDCGEKGVYLEADHIYPFAYFPRLRFDINNGRALCVPCHKKTNTYGERAKQLYG